MLISRIINYFPATLQKIVYKTSFFLISIVFFHFKNKRKKDIFLFSTRRGGSTLLGQIISANSGVRNIDQPLTTHSPPNMAGTLRKETVKKFLPIKKYSQYPSLTDSEKVKITGYINLLVNGKVNLNSWLEFKASRKKMLFYTDRVLLKLTDANAVIDWFVESFNCDVVYLVRHPVANAISVTKNNWGITASAYLDDEYFCEKYLSQEQIDFGENILEFGDYFQQAILNWCLENLVPLNYSTQDFVTLTYEELVMCPEKIIDLLSERFSLNDKERMLHISSLPSFSTVLSENHVVQSIVNESSSDGKYRNLINRWKEKTSEVELNKAMEILDIYNIKIYNCDSSIPAEKYLHFPGCFLASVSSGDVDHV